MDTRQEMRDEGHVVLKRLQDNCLLENSTDQFNPNYVKMHDAVRDMALSITSTKPRYIVQAGLQLKDLPKEEKWMADVEKMSLMFNSISKVPADMPPPKCQLLTTLLLHESGLKKIPNSFFANMPCLGVLNLSDTKIKCLPDSISELKNLTALLLRFCFQLRHVPCLAKLQGLKKLDLSFTGIEEVPEGMDMLINLRYLDLRIETLKGIPVGVLAKLPRLQYLTFNVFNRKTMVKADEVLQLEKLEFFHGCFGDMDELNKFVSSMQQGTKYLIEYQLHVGSYFCTFRSDKGVSINEIELDELDGLPNDIQELNIIKCHPSSGSLSDNISFLKNAIDLRHCSFIDCEGIESVVSSSSFSSSCTPPFQSLETLFLLNLPEMTGIIKDEGFGSAATTSILSPTFSHLKDISVFTCESMKMLFPHWLLPNLQNLEEISVYNCKQLVEIFGAAATSEQGSDIALIKFNLPKLRVLILDGLPELKSICSKSGLMVCDSLRLIIVKGCHKLKRIPPFVPLVGNGQPYEYAPPSLQITSGTEEWWESLEWDDHPNFKNILQPLFKMEL